MDAIAILYENPEPSIMQNEKKTGSDTIHTIGGIWTKNGKGPFYYFPWIPIFFFSYDSPKYVFVPPTIFY